MHKKVTFKEYNMNQLMLPMDLGILIPQNHIVRVVNSAIDKLNVAALLDYYEGGGASAYYPIMMLKVIIYAYTQKIFSCRQIAKALRENINFMWISANNKPDYRTINRFRSEKLKEVIEQVFSSMIELLINEGYIKLENYFLDGTKIEANANKYSFVWNKAVKNHKEKLKTSVKALLEEIDELNRKEDEEYGDSDLEELGENSEVSPEELENIAKELEKKITEDARNKKLKKALKKINDNYLPRCKKYEEQDKVFGGRNSYSKTDHDATFMRMKEDHMKNGQLKPGYNIQIGTENRFVVGFSVHQRPGDTGCMIPHLENLKHNLGRLPKNIIADAGYGSEENYEYLDRQQLGNYVKYNMFHKEQKKSFKEDISRVENLSYDQENDEFICAGQRHLKYVFNKKYKTDNGYETERRCYRCESCDGCNLKDACTKAKGNRQLEVSFRLMKYKKEARANLCSEKGRELRGLRCVEVESTFGRIKGNWSFRRFLLRGIEKVKIEWGLLCIAHNLTKMIPN